MSKQDQLIAQFQSFSQILAKTTQAQRIWAQILSRKLVIMQKPTLDAQDIVSLQNLCQKERAVLEIFRKGYAEGEDAVIRTVNMLTKFSGVLENIKPEQFTIVVQQISPTLRKVDAAALNTSHLRANLQSCIQFMTKYRGLLRQIDHHSDVELQLLHSSNIQSSVETLRKEFAWQMQQLERFSDEFTQLRPSLHSYQAIAANAGDVLRETAAANPDVLGRIVRGTGFAGLAAGAGYATMGVMGTEAGTLFVNLFGVATVMLAALSAASFFPKLMKD